MTTWDNVEEAVARHAEAYADMLTARREHQAGSKKVRAAEDEWMRAHEDRAAALLTHWTEEDGYTGEFKRMGPVLQRYYAAMGPIWKGRAAEEKARKKEDANG